MKKRITLLAGLSLLLLLPAFAQAARRPAKIKFEKLIHDFGTLYEKDGNATCTFRFTNTSKTPLVVIRAQASCGCTVPSYPEEPIAPGDTAEISVEYRTKRRPGEFVKYVFIYTNTNPDRTTLQIKGNVIPDNEDNREKPSSRTYRDGELRTRASQ